MKPRGIIALALLCGAWPSCNPPPVPTPPTPPAPIRTADAAPPAPSPTPTPVPPVPTDRFDLACANIGKVGCADYDPRTCVAALRNALAQNISPGKLTDATIDCLGVAPNKTALRACGFEKCP